MSVLATLANVAGSTLILGALLRFRGEGTSWGAWFRSSRGRGALVLLVAGCVFAVAAYQLLLQEPLEFLLLRTAGPDVFGSIPDQSALRLQMTTRAGAVIVCEVSASRRVPVKPSVEGTKEHRVPWQALVEGAPAGPLRALVAGMRFLNDLRRVESLQAEVVARAPGPVSAPDLVEFLVNGQPSLGLFRGTPVATNEQEGQEWSVTYADETSVAGRFTQWRREGMPSWRSSVGLILPSVVSLAGLLLLLGAEFVLAGTKEQPAETWPDLLRLHLAGLQPLWVSGLALLMMFLIDKLFVLDERTYAWTQYVTLGTVYPALVLTLALLTRSPRFTPGVTQAKLILALLGMLIAAPFLIKHTGFVVLMGFLLQWFLLFTLSRFSTAGQTAAAVGQTKGAADMPAGTLSMYFAVAFVSLACWTVASRFLWWAPFESWLFSSASMPITLVLSLLLVLVGLYGQSPFALVRESYPVVHKLTTALCLLILAGLSFRTDLLFFLDDARASSSYLHWSMFVGPAELVRQGGWLLWDVPSLYGFLNTLVVAAVPVQSAWQAMHLVNGFLLACSAALVFFLLRSLGDGFANTLLALAAAVAAVFLLPGLANDPHVLMGPYVFPSYGAYRFFWGYALVALVVWDFLQPSEKQPRYLIYGVGCLAWLVGSFWSFESAIFCVIIWLPAFACMVLRDALRSASSQGVRSVVLQTAWWLPVPMVLMVLALAVITGYYKAFLGHAPDWYAFYEYALAYKGGYNFVAIDTDGPVWFLFAAFCIVSTTAAYALEEKAVARLSALGAAWTLLWVLASYFAVRGVNNICTTFSPIVCTAVAVVLLVIARRESADDWGRPVTGRHPIENDWGRLARASLVPLLTVLLTMGFGDFKKLPWVSPSAMFQPVEGLRPQVEEPVVQVLRKAGVDAQDPLAYAAYGGDVLRIVPAAGDGTGPITATRAWLPWNPWHATDQLIEERKAVYTVRFIQRARSGGWLLLPTGLAEQEYLAWLFQELEQTHTRTAVVQGEGFDLFRFEFKGRE